MSRLLTALLALLVVVPFAASGSQAAPAAVPHRIVSLSPTATESLFAIDTFRNGTRPRTCGWFATGP